MSAFVSRSNPTLNPRADARNKVKHDEYFSMQYKYYKYFFFNRAG